MAEPRAGPTVDAEQVADGRLARLLRPARRLARSVDLLALSNPMYALLNPLLRRQMRKVVDGLLQGLKQVSERRGAKPA